MLTDSLKRKLISQSTESWPQAKLHHRGQGTSVPKNPKQAPQLETQSINALESGLLQTDPYVKRMADFFQTIHKRKMQTNPQDQTLDYSHMEKINKLLSRQILQELNSRNSQ